MSENLYTNYNKYYSGGISNDFSKISSYYDDDFNKILPLDKKTSFLDIGCGMGHFLYYLSKKGYKNVKGIDISQEQVISARKNVEVTIEKISNIISYLSKNEELFDVITMNDVVEHLPKSEIVETLKSIKKRLTPSGMFICRVPNLSNIFGVYLLHNDFTHETGFTEYSIKQALNISGFDNIEIYGNFTRINSLWKRIFFNIFQQLIFSITKIIFAYVYMPGSRQPKIMTTFLIAVAKKN